MKAVALQCTAREKGYYMPPRQDRNCRCMPSGYFQSSVSLSWVLFSRSCHRDTLRYDPVRTSRFFGGCDPSPANADNAHLHTRRTLFLLLVAVASQHKEIVTIAKRGAAKKKSGTSMLFTCYLHHREARSEYLRSFMIMM